MNEKRAAANVKNRKNIEKLIKKVVAEEDRYKEIARHTRPYSARGAPRADGEPCSNFAPSTVVTGTSQAADTGNFHPTW